MNIQNLAKFPFFTGKMLTAFAGKNHPSVTLSRMRSKLIKIEKGKYTVHYNPLIYATVIVTPSYCSFRSALSYYQLTDQIPLRVQVVTKKRKRRLKEVTFFTSPYLFGFKRTQVDGFDFFVAEKEKLLLDCLLYPRAGVSPGELIELLKEDLDIKKIITYLKEINKLHLTKRAGYLLELSGKDIHPHFHKQISSDKNYSLLNLHLPKTTITNKKWRLFINEDVL